MSTALLFLLECVKVFFMMTIGGFLVFSLVVIVLSILAKLIQYEMDLPLFDEDEEAPDYIEAPDGEKIIYDEDTQE